MKIPKRFWTFTKPCHPTELGSAISCVESFHPHVLKPRGSNCGRQILHHFEKLCYFSPFRIYALWAPAVPGHLILTSEEKVHRIVYGLFNTSMRPPGDEMSRFLPKIWMSLALLAGDQLRFGRWGARVQISRCYYKVLVLISFSKFIQQYVNC